MSKTPEIGQVLFGNPTGDFGTEEWQDALIDYLLEKISRVYWNREQKDIGWNYNVVDFEGMEIRDYSWDGEDEKPNLKFAFSPQEIRWYKHPGRGQSCTLNWKPEEWIEWFNKALWVIRGNDKEI